MLFNSYIFIFVFLPVVLALFFAIGRRQPLAAAGWLGAASLFFYGWWDIRPLPLLIASICVNYSFGILLAGPASKPRKRLLLVAAVTTNLGVLAFFKYANFFIQSANSMLAAADLPPFPLLGIVLPIGISFYTFTQIAFLVDSYQGKVKERGFIHYLLFVTYFPHLIAGPVLHHAQMMPQFAKPEIYFPDAEKIGTGLAIFCIGLAKKLMLADPLGVHADALFGEVAADAMPGAIPAWMGVFAYSFQIYFDFSGYSDMAIGLSLMFGVTLPVNFNGPYKATSIIDFWRRWHITLSTFLRDYLYIPLGGNRHGMVRRHANLLVTMLLGGLWHGASWTFVLWGGVHGVLLIINHVWRMIPVGRWVRTPAFGAVAWLLTFGSVCLAWVLFRAESMSQALAVYAGLFGLNGAIGTGPPLPGLPLMVLLALSFLIIRLPPPAPLAAAAAGAWGDSRVRLAVSAVLGALFAVAIGLISRKSPFLYFQF